MQYVRLQFQSGLDDAPPVFEAEGEGPSTADAIARAALRLLEQWEAHCAR